MTTVGRLKEGDLYLKDELDEELPPITNGLVAHFPLNETLRGIRYKNILDYSTWVAGDTGGATGFGQNGATVENSRVMGTDPWGKPTVLWEASPEGSSNADGGWNTTYFPIDSSKTYRFSVWIKRTVLGNGSAYLGVNASGGSNVLRYTNTASTTTNPYFWSGSLPENEWILVVGHVHGHSYNGGNHPDSGRYTLGGYLGNITRDFKWTAETTTARHRSYLYYSSNTDTRQHWCYPRVDVIDGSEPTIDDLLSGEGNVYNIISANNVSMMQDGIGIGESTTNLLRNGIEIYAPYHDFEQVGNQYRFTMKGTNRLIVFRIKNAGAMAGVTFSASGIMKKNGRPYALNGNRMNTYNAVADNKMFYTNPETGEFRITETMGTSSWMFHTGTRSNDGDIITIDEFQIELGEHTTPYTDDNKGASRLDIPFDLKPPYSINFFHKGLQTLDNITNQASSPMLLQMNTYWTSPSISIWNFSKSLRVYIRGDGTTAWSSTTSHHNYNKNNWDNQLHMYTIVAESSTRFSMYMDGKLLGSQTSSAAVMGITYLSMGSSYQPNAIYRDFSLYDKALSATEIAKLYDTPMNITKAGVLKAEINEGFQIDDGSPHWLPLGDSPASEDQRMTPTTENHVVFEDGALWGGDTTNNVYNLNVSASNWPSNSSNMAQLTTITGPHSFEVKGTSNVPNAYSYVYPNYATSNAVHSFQATLTNRNSKPVRITMQVRDGNNGNSLTSTGSMVIEPGETRKVKLPGTNAVSSGRVTPAISVYSDNNDGTVDVNVHDIQLEARGFCSPYTDSSRGRTRLEYTPVPINDKPFALSMWVKQVGIDNSHSMPFDAYGQLYISLRDNMRLHFSFLNNGSQASIYSPVGTTQLNQWHHIGAIKTASRLEMYLDGKLVASHNASGTGYNLSASKIGLGSYGANYPFNGYIRDVIIDPDITYLTRFKIEEIYKTQMRSKKHGATSLSGQVIEDEALL